jgi:sulfane dehydrogenase subunit SoxC
VKRGASWIVAEGSDANKYTMSIPLATAMDDILVAYAQNGEPVRPKTAIRCGSSSRDGKRFVR